MTKKKFVLRIDDDVYHALEGWAAAEFRSVNGQIEWLLTQALRAQKRRPDKTAADTPPADWRDERMEPES